MVLPEVIRLRAVSPRRYGHHTRALLLLLEAGQFVPQALDAVPMASPTRWVVQLLGISDHHSDGGSLAWQASASSARVVRVAEADRIQPLPLHNPCLSIDCLYRSLYHPNFTLKSSYCPQRYLLLRDLLLALLNRSRYGVPSTLDGRMRWSWNRGFLSESSAVM